MKWNWGTGLAVGMGLFVFYIMFMVVQAVRTDWHLEADDYYAKELNYQSEIDRKKNVKTDQVDVEVALEGTVLKLKIGNFPIDSGTVYLFRPSDKNLDRRFKLNMDGGVQNIDLSKNTKGKYNLELTWWKGGKGYMVEKGIVLR